MKVWRVVLADGSAWPVTAHTAFGAVVRLGLNKVIGVEPA